MFPEETKCQTHSPEGKKREGIVLVYLKDVVMPHPCHSQLSVPRPRSHPFPQCPQPNVWRTLLKYKGPALLSCPCRHSRGFCWDWATAKLAPLHNPASFLSPTAVTPQSIPCTLIFPSESDFQRAQPMTSSQPPHCLLQEKNWPTWSMWEEKLKMPSTIHSSPLFPTCLTYRKDVSGLPTLATYLAAGSFHARQAHGGSA